MCHSQCYNLSFHKGNATCCPHAALLPISSFLCPARPTLGHRDVLLCTCPRCGVHGLPTCLLLIHLGVLPMMSQILNQPAPASRLHTEKGARHEHRKVRAGSPPGGGPDPPHNPSEHPPQRDTFSPWPHGFSKSATRGRAGLAMEPTSPCSSFSQYPSPQP